MAISYSISGGADAAKFNIDAATGVLTFKAAPDFETPGDANGDNVYEVEVCATDVGGLYSTKPVKVTVTDTSEGSPPQITSAGAISVKENQTTVMTVTATDPDEGGGTPPPTGANDVSAVMYNHVGAPFRTDQYFQAPWGFHEGALHGAPLSYDWAAGAKPSNWMNMASHTTPWGQAFEWAGESPETNIRIHVKNHLIYALVNNVWKLLAHSDQVGIGGGNYKEDFTGGAGGSNLRSEGTGQVSFNMMSGQLFHFWLNNWPRTVIPSGTTAFYTSCEMRLIPNTNSGVDLSKAKYLGACSSDYYPSGTATAAIAPGMSIPRHKYITPEWKIFSSYIGGAIPKSEAEYRDTITSNPLPPGVTP